NAGEALAALWEGLGELETLEVLATNISAACASRIAAAQWPQNLSALWLSSPSFPLAASRALAQAPGLRTLRCLKLQGGASRAAALLGSPHLAGLETLSLWDASSDAAIEALCAGPSAATLSALSACYGPLTERAAVALTRCAALTELRLSHNQ